jgi:hypothetical protein
MTISTGYRPSIEGFVDESIPSGFGTALFGFGISNACIFLAVTAEQSGFQSKFQRLSPGTRTCCEL